MEILKSFGNNTGKQWSVIEISQSCFIHAYLYSLTVNVYKFLSP